MPKAVNLLKTNKQKWTKNDKKMDSDYTVITVFKADFNFLNHSLFSLKGDILS